MRHSAILVFDRHGISDVRKKMPKLGSGQYAVRITLEVPDSLFSPVIPHALITVPERAVFQPELEVVQPEQPPELIGPCTCGHPWTAHQIPEGPGKAGLCMIAGCACMDYEEAPDAPAP